MQAKKSVIHSDLGKHHGHSQSLFEHHKNFSMIHAPWYVFIWMESGIFQKIYLNIPYYSTIIETRGGIMNILFTVSLLLAVIGVILTVYGWKKKSVLTIFFGIFLILIPIFYAVDVLKQFVPFIPVIALGISFLCRKKFNSA